MQIHLKEKPMFKNHSNRYALALLLALTASTAATFLILARALYFA